MLWVLLLAAVTSGVPDRDRTGKPTLRSESVLIRLADTGEVLIEKNADVVRPIASITKLLSALTMKPHLDPFDAVVTISDSDKDKLKWSKSRLVVGLEASRDDLLSAGLCASDNRAMYALVRSMGFDRSNFANLMNATALQLNMKRSRFVDAAGIDPGNVSTARDLAELLDAAADDPTIRQKTKIDKLSLYTRKGRSITLMNPDRLARSGKWDLVVGKTGYTVEAGRSLIVRVILNNRPIDMVFLGAREMASVFGDASRVRKWLEPKLGLTAAR